MINPMEDKKVRKAFKLYVLESNRIANGMFLPVLFVGILSFGLLATVGKNLAANLGLAAFSFSILCFLSMPTQAKLPGKSVPFPLPIKVESSLPIDVSLSDVRIVKGSYVFIQEGEIFPLEDADGNQIFHQIG